ncbi:hypothetical protein I316_02680 [Kwoniella heveanensis BCC8398]|uniref:Uncharacterized protein n=1 Tax=Kwoniella heveanensis BCC8398 TaxID=1296120 RepID=A0A1B9GXF3_9TREE|nr:hypothetical protein I316_02680 [Kwoniella heveanensis BCC8398]
MAYHGSSDSDWLSDRSSPSESERDYMQDDEGDGFSFSPESKNAELPSPTSSTMDMHSPPTSTPSTCPSSPSNKQSSISVVPSKPLASRYPRIFVNPPSAPPVPTASRAGRIRGLSPLTNISNSSSSSTQQAAGGDFHTPRLPKSQPLSRALFARSLAPDTNQAGLMLGGKKKTSQKVIVPTKSFRTTFELGLSASELARKD